MDGITIHIGWEYFLGLMGGIVAVAWYANGRFSAIETSIEWIKDILLDLKDSEGWPAKEKTEQQNPDPRTRNEQLRLPI